MRLNSIAILFVSVILTASAYADGKYTCKDTSNYGITNELTVRGSGTAATIHLESSAVSGDLTYNDAYTQAAQQAGYDVFVGTMTDKLDTPPSQIQGAFLFQPALLNGGVGSMEQFGQDSFVVLNCVKAQ
jgi:hypothetical protein